MTLVVLTGRIGVGKSTTQQNLLLEFGLPIIMTYTTRHVSAEEVGMSHLPPKQFTDAVASGSLCAPMAFGGQWYGWPRDRFLAAAGGRESNASVTARPYTALLLGSVLNHCQVILLTTDPDELARRRATRSALRDLDDSARARLEADEQEFTAYGDLFRTRVDAGPKAAATIIGGLA